MPIGLEQQALCRREIWPHSIWGIVRVGKIGLVPIPLLLLHLWTHPKARFFREMGLMWPAQCRCDSVDELSLLKNDP